MGIYIGHTRQSGGFQLFRQADQQDGVYANFTTRDSYFTANPDELSRLDNNPNLVIKVLDNGSGQVVYQQRFNNSWVDVSGVIQGEAGPAGATGNSYFFSSVSNRDSFFQNGTNKTLLEKDLPITVNNGNKISSTYVWGGETSPALYDAEFWRVSAIETSSGTLFLGESGARVNSGNEVLGFIAPDGDKHYLHGIEYSDSGNMIPRYWKLGSLKDTVLSSVAILPLSSPNNIGLSLPEDSLIVKFRVIPAEVGSLRVRSWASVDDTGPLVLDEDYEVLAGDVGNVTEFVLPNDFLAESGKPIYVSFTGISLQGGLQVSGPFTGQTVLYIEQATQQATSARYQEEVGSFLQVNKDYNAQGTTTGGLVAVYEGSNVVTTVANQTFTQGVDGVNNPSVVTVGSDVFSDNDIVSFIPDSDSDDENKGFYEVLSHTGNLLTVTGVGLTGNTHSGLVKDQFITQKTSGTFRKVGISGLSVNASGELQRFKGDNAPLVFDEISAGERPSKLAYFFDESNSTPTLLDVLGQYYDIACSLSGSLLNDFLVVGNTLVYVGTIPINVKIDLTATVQPVSLLDSRFLLKAFKNGSPIAGRGIGRVKPNNIFDLDLPISVKQVVSLNTGDVLTFRLANATGALSSAIITTLTGLIEELR